MYLGGPMKQLASLSSVVLATLLYGAALAQSTQPASTPITEFGAVGDGMTMNTSMIQKAIDHAAEAGGGTVEIPKGVFLSGAIFLKSGVNLHIAQDGVLKGSTDVADYPKMQTRIEGHFQEWLPALVNSKGATHLDISGEGTLDGSGQPYWDAF